MTFAGQLVRRVNPHLISDCQLGSRVVKHIRRPSGEDGVTLRIGVGTKPEEDFAGVVNVHVRVHDNDVLGEHHLAHTPKAVHDFVSLHGKALFYAHENQIVKHPFRWQRQVHNFRKVHLNDGQKEAH